MWAGRVIGPEKAEKQGSSVLPTLGPCVIGKPEWMMDGAWNSEGSGSVSEAAGCLPAALALQGWWTLWDLASSIPQNLSQMPAVESWTHLNWVTLAGTEVCCDDHFNHFLPRKHEWGVAGSETHPVSPAPSGSGLDLIRMQMSLSSCVFGSSCWAVHCRGPWAVVRLIP